MSLTSTSTQGDVIRSQCVFLCILLTPFSHLSAQATASTEQAGLDFAVYFEVLEVYNAFSAFLTR